jgi:predicted pyridoxine 5'-phosphate oxidase superfamily flavin-nucleotide-binding protein
MSAPETVALPGSDGEHELQEKCNTTSRANAFYRHQVLSYLNPLMQDFVTKQEMMFVGTADRHGEADTSFRAGLAGFIRVLDEKTLAYPEYRGNGVMSSLGNIVENPHVGLLFVDFAEKIGLHVNGRARIVENDELLRTESASELSREDISPSTGRGPERWVVVSVVEAYIHCSKHIPRMQKIDEEIQWGTDDVRAKGGDYFRAKASPRTQ